MVTRLRSALSRGDRVAGADASFYMHEVSEATMMGKGMAAEPAHQAALLKYGVSPFSVYAPEVVRAFPAHFSSAWTKFWGVE